MFQKSREPSKIEPRRTGNREDHPRAADLSATARADGGRGDANVNSIEPLHPTRPKTSEHEPTNVAGVVPRVVDESEAQLRLSARACARTLRALAASLDKSSAALDLRALPIGRSAPAVRRIRRALRLPAGFRRVVPAKAGGARVTAAIARPIAVAARASTATTATRLSTRRCPACIRVTAPSFSCCLAVARLVSRPIAVGAAVSSAAAATRSTTTTTFRHSGHEGPSFVIAALGSSSACCAAV